MPQHMVGCKQKHTATVRDALPLQAAAAFPGGGSDAHHRDLLLLPYHCRSSVANDVQLLQGACCCFPNADGCTSGGA
jgi:hypothetical protein